MVERESIRMKRRAVSLEESIFWCSLYSLLHVNCLLSGALYRGNRDDVTQERHRSSVAMSYI